MRRLQVFACREMFGGDRISLFLKQIIGGGAEPAQVFRGAPITMNRITAETEGAMPQPSVALEREEAQFLMDQLWDCGLRPTEGTGSAGAMAAQQSHLNDMRRIVAHTLKLTERL